MRSIMVVGMVFAVLFVVGYANVARSGGIEPGPGTDCMCIPAPDESVQIDLSTKKGPYLKGVFTVSAERCSTENFIVHLSLKWGNRLLLKTFEVPNGGAVTPCIFTEELIKAAIYDLPCILKVEEGFGLVGTPLIKELIITDKNCGNGDTNNDIIMGEIIIAIVPTLQCE
jgi:hypothetical protein